MWNDNYWSANYWNANYWLIGAGEGIAGGNIYTRRPIGFLGGIGRFL